MFLIRGARTMVPGQSSRRPWFCSARCEQPEAVSPGTVRGVHSTKPARRRHDKFPAELCHVPACRDRSTGWRRGRGRMAPPASTTISTRLRRVQEHSSRVKVLPLRCHLPLRPLGCRWPVGTKLIPPYVHGEAGNHANLRTTTRNWPLSRLS